MPNWLKTDKYDASLREHLNTDEGLKDFKEFMWFRGEVKKLVQDDVWTGCRDQVILDALKARLQPKRCSHEPTEAHSCPYEEDVNEDPDFRCTCCAACTHECGMSI